MKRLLAVTALVAFAAACNDAVHMTQPESTDSPAPIFDRGGVPNAASGLEPSVVGAFEVNVKVTSTLLPDDTGPVGTEFSNCYTLQGDGVWIDPLFPGGPGTWTHAGIRGATARYTASAQVDIPGLGVLAIDQSGTVTPYRGRDGRKLKAYSAVSVVADGTVLAEYLSRGDEVGSCSP